MKRTIIAAVFLACAGTLMAQAPAEKAKPAAAKPAAAAPAPAPAAAPAEQPAVKKPAPAPKPAPKPAEEPEEAMVMIDDRAEPEARPAAGAADGEERAQEPGGIPASYGQCKGVTSEGGRTILIFENPDSGELTFVQVVFGKTGVSWRRLDSIRRYGSEAVSGGSDADFN